MPTVFASAMSAPPWWVAYCRSWRPSIGRMVMELHGAEIGVNAVFSRFPPPTRRDPCQFPNRCSALDNVY